jgi:hypothetical protein
LCTLYLFSGIFQTKIIIIFYRGGHSVMEKWNYFCRITARKLQGWNSNPEPVPLTLKGFSPWKVIPVWQSQS